MAFTKWNFQERLTASLKRENFEVTDTSEPPEPSIWYSQCGSQTAITQCMIIASGGETGPGVARTRTSVGELDRLLEGPGWRNTTRMTHLPGVAKDIPRILNLIQNDPKKSVTKAANYPKFNKDEIISHLSNCEEKEGALIWYAGHGTKDGDWKFNDGTVLTFEDILDLYGKYFWGRLLYIVTDCCYSGRWVTKLAERLDEMEVGACGHQAKRLGCFIKIFASCRYNETAVDEHYVKFGVRPANDGTMEFPHEEQLGPQTTLSLDTTSMRCFHDPSSDCFLHKMKPCHQWKWVNLVKDSECLAQRFLALSTLHHWYYVFLHDPKYHTLSQISEEQLPHHGYILAEGDGFQPPYEVSSKMCSYSPMNYPNKYRI